MHVFHARRGPRSLVFALVLAVTAWIAWRTFGLLDAAWPFSTDDAYITLRYARNLADGHGLAWNPGQPPVEGYSNLLFVLLGAAALQLGADPILTFKMVSCIALAGTCGLTYWLMRRWTGPLAATLPALVITANEGVILWAVSGLETIVYQCLVLAALATFIAACERHGPGVRFAADETPPQRGREQPLMAASGLLVFTACLARPEGPMIGMIIGGSLLAIGVWQFRRPAGIGALRSLCVFTATSLAPLSVYVAWRWLYYGALVPNSVACKAGFDGNPWSLILPFVSMSLGLLTLALLFPKRRIDIRFAVLLAVPMAYVAILYGVDPIIGYKNRHFLAAYACIAVLGMASLSLMARRLNRWLPDTGIQAILVIAVALWFGNVAARQADIADWAQDYAARMAQRQALGDWLDARLAPDEWLLIGDTGMVPYRTQANVMDAYCLNSRPYTRSGIDGDPGRFIDRRVLQQRPRVIVVHSRSADMLKPHSYFDFYPDLVTRAGFEQHYTPVKVFGAAGDSFYYWVYARRAASPD